MQTELPPHIRVQALAWREHSRDLARWAMDHLVNRDDVWGQFGPAPIGSERPYRVVTLPIRSRRGGAEKVSLDKLARHFGTLRRSHIIGLHAVSIQKTCRWLAVDLDVHKPELAGARERREANWRAAHAWRSRLEGLGYEPLLIDSNGVGGLHLWILFEQRAALADTHAFGERLIADWAQHGLWEPPELYPRSSTVKGLGAFLRLPGLHHYLDHMSRVWDGVVQNGLWLEGEAAAEALLEVRPGPLPEVAALPGGGTGVEVHYGEAPAYDAVVGEPRDDGRHTIYLDLDGVLAGYDRFRHPTYIGEPLEGARAFVEQLRRRGEVVLYSGRLSSGAGHDAVVAWLKRNGMEVDRLDASKPLASAFVDDRAVVCRPQAIGPAAFERALARIDVLLGREPAAESHDPSLVHVLDAWAMLSPEERQRIRVIVDEALARYTPNR